MRRMAVSRNGMISQVSNASQEIDSIIQELRDWRGETLARLRASIKRASPSVVEDVKWKKPSNPAGVPVWSREGIVCIGEALKNSVRLTFPKGALTADPKKLCNARLDSKTNRAIDVREDEQTPGRSALQQLQSLIGHRHERAAIVQPGKLVRE